MVALSARALYSRPEVLVFDEPTSALDNETEREISQAIDALAGQRTIIIAHRLSTIRHCDVIHLMQKGQVVDSGRFEDLVAHNADFRTMTELGQLERPGADNGAADGQ